MKPRPYVKSQEIKDNIKYDYRIKTKRVYFINKHLHYIKK